MLDALLFSKTPAWLTALYPDCIWKMAGSEKVLYLTFDDGPVPEATPAVLHELKQWKAAATFFCIGKNITSYPDILEQLIEEGHTVGNHTFSHVNGWQVLNRKYYTDVEKGREAILAHSPRSVVKFFRPPYGKLRPSQYRFLKSKYRIVMWDVLSFDFDRNVSREAVLNNVIHQAGPGSVIVFHDSVKAKEKMLFALPRVLEHFSKQGYKFEALC